MGHVKEAIGYLVLSDQGSGANNATSRTSSPQSPLEATAPKPGLWLYPNPVHVGDEIALEGLATGPNQLIVYNAQGQVLLREETVNQKKPDTTVGNRAYTFVRCQNAQGTQTRRLLMVE